MNIPRLKRTKDGAFMLADLMEKHGLCKRIGHQEPYWTPQIPAKLMDVMRQVHVPVVGWAGTDGREVLEGTPVTPIDFNGAYVAAASSAEFAHSLLEPTGPHNPETMPILPGYYLVDAHPWQLDAPGSPLGGGRIPAGPVWVTHVTYKLLRDLTFGCSWAAAGHWPDIKAYDSWTSPTAWRMNDWTNAIRDARAEILRTGDEEAYRALKLGYSQAVQMWITPPDPRGTAAAERKKHNKAYRPDWYHTLHAQHHFNMWYRAYRATMAGCPPLRMGGRGMAVDGMLFTTDDLGALLVMEKSPIRLDETKATLGTFKRGKPYYYGIELEEDGG